MFNGTTAKDFHVPVSKEMLLESIERYREAGGRIEHQARKEYLDWIVDDLIHERDALRMTVQALLDEIKKDRVAFDDQAREFRRLKTEHAPLYLHPPTQPLSYDQVKSEFSKHYPKDLPLIELAENNRDFRMQAIGAYHHLTAFDLGVKAAEQAHGIK